MKKPLEFTDIQGLVLSGYGEKPAARYVVFEIVDAERVRAWLSRTLSTFQFGTFRRSAPQAPPFLDDLCINIAFTHEGFRRFGLPASTLNGFSLPFQEGMNEASRARRLGDDGPSDPERWAWGNRGQPVHGLLALFAGEGDADPEDWVKIQEFIDAQVCRAHGLRIVKELDTLASNQARRKEHFGFRDGIANPQLEGLPRDHADDVIALGEILLGHENAYGKLSLSPEVPADADPQNRLSPVEGRLEARDFGKNGSYLVFRQLAQDVQAFWQYIERARRLVPDAPPGRAGREWLASKFVGRWPNGTPLTRFPNAPGPTTGHDSNSFSYGLHDDSFGTRCPIGSHIRRTNPRDTALPVPHDPELSGDPKDASTRQERLMLTARHRILRRGRAYGPPVDENFDLDALLNVSGQEERGLHFLCFNANLGRQFEFVQSNWAQNPTFAGLSSDPDPLLGAHREVPFNASDFTIQGCPVRRVRDLPRVVEVRGGAYFFMPSRRALEFLAVG
ncbi:MAG: peroxidase [Pseudomonadota bacterium]